jgi:dipeptidyl aminopeptidase/acylaminoacyl peptidase
MTATQPKVATAPFGSWASPFAIELLTVGVVRLGGISFDRSDGSTWWLEGRPDDEGRSTLVRLPDGGEPADVSPAGMNVRSRVHEYGGGAYVAAADVAIVSSFTDGRLYRLGPDRTATPLTPEGALRYADCALDGPRGRLVGVREDHSPATVERHGQAENAIVAISLSDGEATVLVSGRDFYSSPRLSRDGSRLAWLEWDHPNLPWDGTELKVADVAADGALGPATAVAGSASDWIAQPRWSPSGELIFVAEPDGWMNLYRWADGRIEAVVPLAAEFAYPDWIFGLHNYDTRDDGTIAAIGRNDGRDRLYLIGPGPDAVRDVDLVETEIGSVGWIDERTLLVDAAGPGTTDTIFRLDIETGERTVLRRSSDWSPEPADLSVGEHVEFPTTGGRTAHGIFYPPANRAFQGPSGERPPLIVTSHGGPTAQAYTGLSVVTQLFTSRGYAVLDVDYGGSTGYGREYRKRLEGEWGVVDVDDCCAGATWLAGQGRVDAERVAIRGGSASGFTTLAALAFRDTFRAGVTYFGIGDLEAFAKETHKFESRYLDRLIGPLPESRDLYRERSPAHHAEGISAPVLVLQGLEDRVVPPAEAERIVDALWERGIPHAYLAFKGEDHGFRKAENIIRSFEAELSFLGQVFGSTPADDIEPVDIVRPGGPT